MSYLVVRVRILNSILLSHYSIAMMTAYKHEHIHSIKIQYSFPSIDHFLLLRVSYLFLNHSLIEWINRGRRCYAADMYWCTQQQQRQRSCLHIKLLLLSLLLERESTIHAHIVAIQLEPTRNCCLLPIYHQRDTLNVIIVVCTALIENKKGEEDEAERKRWWHTTKTITKTPISITF